MRLTLVQKSPIKLQEHIIRITERPTAARPETATRKPVTKSPVDEKYTTVKMFEQLRNSVRGGD